MKFTDRLMAAFNAFSGKVPSGKAEQNPYFYHFSVGNTPARDVKINAEQLRNFSETVVVRRAIDYLRNQVGRLAWNIEAKDGRKLTRVQTQKLLAAKEVLQSPNPDDNFQSFLGQIIEDMLVIGMGVSEIKPWNSTAGQPAILYPVDAASVQIYMDWDGTPSKPRYAQVDLRGQRIDFKNYELLVVKHNPRSNTPFGLSPVEVAVQQIQYLLQAQAYAGQTASNATPKKLLYLGQEITEKQLSEFRIYFKNEIEGRSHMPIIGGNDQPHTIDLGLSNDQNLFLQWQSFLIALIANVFGLDALKFNAFVGINRSTGDVLDDISDESAVRPLASSIAHSINQQLLSVLGIADFAEFKFHYTTSNADRKALGVIHQLYMQMDVMTINEARREIGLADLPYSDVIGKSKGDLTLSEYRGIFGGFVSLQDAIGIDEDTHTDGTQKILKEKNETDAKVKQDQVNQKKAEGTTDPNKGGNNGVYGAPNPKGNKAMNQRNDHSMDL